MSVCSSLYPINVIKAHLNAGRSDEPERVQFYCWNSRGPRKGLDDLKLLPPKIFKFF